MKVGNSCNESWIDGDDAEHRYTVRVNLVANHDMHSQGENPDGSYVTEYQAGQVVATVDLTESDLWFAEVDIPIGGLSYQDFTAVEVGLVASDNGTPDDMSDDTVYNALTREEVAQIQITLMNPGLMRDGLTPKIVVSQRLSTYMKCVLLKTIPWILVR